MNKKLRDSMIKLGKENGLNSKQIGKRIKGFEALEKNFDKCISNPKYPDLVLKLPLTNMRKYWESDNVSEHNN